MDFFPGQSSHSLAQLSSAFQILPEEVLVAAKPQCQRDLSLA
jgi:hypothetical protein